MRHSLRGSAIFGPNAVELIPYVLTLRLFSTFDILLHYIGVRYSKRLCRLAVYS